MPSTLLDSWYKIVRSPTRYKLEKLLPNFVIDVGRVLFARNRFAVTRHGPITFNYDGLISTHLVDFMEDEKFINALEKGRQYTDDRDDYYRLYHYCSFALHATKLEGDFVECGVWLGVGAKSSITYTDFNKTGKKFYLVDTYEGIPINEHLLEKDDRGSQDYTTDGKLDDGGAPTGKTDVVDLVKKKFNGDNVEIVKGFVPDILTNVPSEKIAFLHIDMNNAYPEVEAIRYFWDKLVTGGIILLDDYAYSIRFEMQKTMIDKLGEELGYTPTTLPTGQGLIIKA